MGDQSDLSISLDLHAYICKLWGDLLRVSFVGPTMISYNTDAKPSFHRRVPNYRQVPFGRWNISNSIAIWAEKGYLNRRQESQRRCHAKCKRTCTYEDGGCESPTPTHFP
jgi:hypothetical protein